jgi:hypothetical protein
MVSGSKLGRETFGNIHGAMYKRLRRTGDEAFNVWNSILKTIQNHSTSMKAPCS